MKLNKIILYVIILIMGVYIYNQYTKLQGKEAVIRQNGVAIGDTTTFINNIWSKKVAFVKDLNVKKDSLLKSRDETILNQQKLIITLKSINDSGFGVIVHDTSFVSEGSDTAGRHLLFKNHTSFYNYDINVWAYTVPKYSFKLMFNPFELSVYLARNDKGIWSGYTKVGANAKNFLTISKLNVFVNKDNFLKTTTEKFNLKLGISGGLSANPVIQGLYGIKALINKKYELSYMKGIGYNYQQLTYTWFFNFIGD